jgi:integral membrane sensor domain MASE1
MHLRVTTESDTFAYATSPLNFAGLEPEDLIFLVLPMAVGSTIELQPLLSTLMGVFCLWLYKEITANQPSGFMSLWISSNIGYMLDLPVVQKNKLLRRMTIRLIKLVNYIWISNGMLPTPSYCNLYER